MAKPQSAWNKHCAAYLKQHGWSKDWMKKAGKTYKKNGTATEHKKKRRTKRKSIKRRKTAKR